MQNAALNPTQHSVTKKSYSVLAFTLLAILGCLAYYFASQTAEGMADSSRSLMNQRVQAVLYYPVIRGTPV